MKISATMNEALWFEDNFDFYAAKQNGPRKSIKEKRIIYIGQKNLALNTWSTLAQLVNRKQQLPLLLARPTWDYPAWPFLGPVSWRPKNTTSTSLVVHRIDNQIVLFLFGTENNLVQVT